jgi:cytochrome c oxidase subunit 2
MRPPGTRVRQLAAAAALLATSLLFSGCELFSSDQNTLAPKGEVAEKQADLLWIVIWIALAVLIVVFAGLVYALIRYRRKSDDDPLPKQVHGNTRLELTWTIIPTVILLGLAYPIVDGIIDLADTPGEDALHVRVLSSQWQWAFEYLDDEYLDADGKPLRVDRDLHIPVDRDIAIEIEASDVIHSFWVPKLGGKTDAIPGRTNHMWFNANEPGTYAGQCAEFCGIPAAGGGHPAMKFTVVAETQADFDAWAQEQLAGAGASSGALTPEQQVIYDRFREAAPAVDPATAIGVARSPEGAAVYMQAAYHASVLASARSEASAP